MLEIEYSTADSALRDFKHFLDKIRKGDLNLSIADFSSNNEEIIKLRDCLKVGIHLFNVVDFYIPPLRILIITLKLQFLIDLIKIPTC